VTRRQLANASPVELENLMRDLVKTLVAPYARPGFGGAVVAAPKGSSIRVDGRAVGVAPLPDALALPAGRHTVDVLLPSGDAVLYRPTILEGTRVAIDGRQGLTHTAQDKTLLWTSYGVWAAGAVAIASSFVAGALMRRELSEVRPCVSASEPCSGFTDATARTQRAQGYAQAGNILLGAGAGLSLTGAALFTWDVMGTSPEGAR
jgi:hypothetical protein